MVHQAIEFGNRMLTFVVSAAAAAAVIAMYQARRRTELKVYAWLNVAGIVVQAIIGAISVFLKLQWWAVALHFLPSMVLVWLAGMLYVRCAEPDDGTPQHLFPNTVRWLAALATMALAVVLMTGTMVTGSGVHSGDDGVGMEGRLEVNTEHMAIYHAICMYAYLALTIIAVILLYRFKATHESKLAGLILIAVILCQWAIGVFQFYQHVPRWTVPIHIGFASIVTACTALLWAQGYRRVRDGVAYIAGNASADEKYAARQAALAARGKATTAA